MNNFLSVLDKESSLEIINYMIKMNSGVKAYKSKIASAAGCHLSFFSLILAGKSFLSQEHAISLCGFWGFNDLETDYFLALVNMEKATTPLLVEKYKRDIEKIRASSDGYVYVGGDAESFDLRNDDAMHYVSTWHFPAIHLSLRLPGLSRSKAIAERFGLAEDKVDEILNALLQMGLVKREGESWIYVQSANLQKVEIPIRKIFYQEMRRKALMEFDARHPDNFFYSSWFTISKQDRARVRDNLKAYLKEISDKLVEPDRAEEEVVSLCIDFFAF